MTYRHRTMDFGGPCGRLCAVVLGLCTMLTAAVSWQAAVDEARKGGAILPAEDAAGAVDGKVGAGFAFHTDQQDSPWWQVDLGQRYDLARVVIHGAHCSERLASFRMLVSDEGHNWREAYRHGKKVEGKGPFEVSLQGHDGHFVRIQASGTTWMHLAEVQVYGRDTGEKNLALRRPALQSSISRWSTRSVRLQDAVADWREDMAAGSRALQHAVRGTGPEASGLMAEAEALVGESVRLDDKRWLELYARARAASRRWGPVKRQFPLIDLTALERALNYLCKTFPEDYPASAADSWRLRLSAFKAEFSAICDGVDAGEESAWRRAADLVAFQRRLLLSNPLLDMDQVLVIRRRSGNLGLPANWQSNCVLRRTGYDNDLAVMPLRDDGAALRTVYRPEKDVFVGDIELHPDGDRLLFSASHPDGPWQVYEAEVDGADGTLRGVPRQVTPDMGSDVSNYDACYLPNDDIMFCSTAPMVAVPCVNGNTHVANLFRMRPDGQGIRQLCFDQEHNWCPTVLNNGRVMYLRWEYADTPHANSRILFHMNPDGTGQMEIYGSNSYWPNGIFYARPIPGHPTQVVGIVTGHHGVRRMGELVVFDPALGRREADGVVQRIPGFGEPVEPLVRDRLVDASWPKFLHPFPLGRSDGTGSGAFFLVSMQPSSGALWGIYLVDRFDNMVLLKELPGYALFEPVPLVSSPRAPVIPDKVDLSRDDGVVYLTDIHRGPGLAGIPRGEAVSLRLFTYTYGYRKMGGLYGTIGLDGPWDVRRILGTVPIQPDGSAVFRIPANTPIAIQPLDAEGKALQIMRSWFTAMPGEVLSCVGCHEIQNEAPPSTLTMASRKSPDEIEEWHAPARGFAFEREVQPVLDAHCIRCHNGETRFRDKPVFTLRAEPLAERWHSKMSGHAGKWGGKFTTGYVNLHRFVRHPGIESDMHMVHPMDFHADTTELVQVLRKGHYGVALNDDEWSRLITWIDLNTPYHGDWSSIAGDSACAAEDRRAEMRKRYANVDERHIEPPVDTTADVSIVSTIAPMTPRPIPEVPGWPLTTESARERQSRPAESVPLPGGGSIRFAYIPPGTFVMGSSSGPVDEGPPCRVRIERGFWMATTETTNSVYSRFDPTHDSRREHKQGYQFGVRGYPLNEPDQPVARVSWREALAFCEWLRQVTGLPVDLPTEAQWEYACRAGTATPFWYGAAGSDFAAAANVADAKTSEFASNPYTEDQPIQNPPPFDDWLPKDSRFNDGGLVSRRVGAYSANAWGLCDMHGNVAEWTRSLYRPYPYAADDGRNHASAPGARVVRGGSWRDRPKRCTSSYRLWYRPYQGVFNVGFRVIVDADLPTLAR